MSDDTELAGSQVDLFDSDPSDLPGDSSGGEEEFEAASESPATEPEEAAETAESGSVEEAPKNAAPAEAAPPAAKQLTFKVGDKAVPIDESAVVEWKVDGKPTPVAVKDLLQNYAGKVAWEKRLNDVALERKAVKQERTGFETERERHRSLITDLHTKVQEGKTLDAVASLVQMTGLKVDPREYVKQLRESLIQQAKQLAAMKPEDRARHELEEEREYLASQRKSWEQQRQAEQAHKAFEQRVAKAVQASGMSEEDFSQTYDWIKAKTKESGGDPSQVSPEYVVQHVANKRAYEVARDAIASVEPDAIENDLVKDEARWDKLAALVKAHPEFTAEEFAEMYRESRQAKLAKTVSKKVAKAPVPTVASAAARAKPRQTDDAFDPRRPKISSADLEW